MTCLSSHAAPSLALALALGLMAPLAVQAQSFGSSELRCVLQPLRDTALSTSGREIVSERLVELGDAVAPGDVLVRFFSGGLFARIDRAQAELDLANRKQARAERLRNVMTAAEREVTQTEVLLRQADLNELQQDAARFELRAPHPGIVVETRVDVGEVAEDGPAIRLVQIDRLRAEFDLPIRYLGRFSVGARISIENEEQDRRNATVVFVDPLVDMASRSFRMLAVVENPQADWIAGTFCDLPASEG